MNKPIPCLRVDQPATYRIQVQGRIDASWADWFGAARIDATPEGEEPPVTTMTGEVVDQAALYGWLSRLRDLGLPLLLVERLSPGSQQPETIEKPEPGA